MSKLLIAFFLTVSIYAQSNVTDANKTDNNVSRDNNKSEYQKNLQKAIEKEKKYKKEQKFYMGKDYNLTDKKIDKKTLDNVPLIEPEYDFDITDLYNDQ